MTLGPFGADDLSPLRCPMCDVECLPSVHPPFTPAGVGNMKEFIPKWQCPKCKLLFDDKPGAVFLD